MKPEEIQDENMEDIVYRKVTKKEKAEEKKRKMYRKMQGKRMKM